MKKFLYNALLLLGLCGALAACEDEDSLAQRRKIENRQIENFLKTGKTLLRDNQKDTLLYVKGNIKVISEAEFEARGYTTDVSQNEYVLFGSSGVYMQVLQKGVGDKLAENSSATILARYKEFNIATDSLQSTNMYQNTVALPEVMSISNTYGTIKGSFSSGVFYSNGITAVPAGWLLPFKYINIGRAEGKNDEIAKIRLIVPSSSGTTYSSASTRFYPCFYELTLQRGRS